MARRIGCACRPSGGRQTRVGYDRPMTSAALERRAPSIAQIVSGAAVALALGYLAWRGIWRTGAESGDLAVAFAAGRAWLLGHDPYGVSTLAGDFAAGG